MKHSIGLSKPYLITQTHTLLHHHRKHWLWSPGLSKEGKKKGCGTRYGTIIAVPRTCRCNYSMWTWLGICVVSFRMSYPTYEQVSHFGILPVSCHIMSFPACPSEYPSGYLTGNVEVSWYRLVSYHNAEGCPCTYPTQPLTCGLARVDSYPKRTSSRSWRSRVLTVQSSGRPAQDLVRRGTGRWLNGS